MKDTLKIKTHHWGPYPPIQKVVTELAAEKKLIVEISPGNIPFALASEFVDWQVSPALAGKKVHCLDINQNSLPYQDKSVDFIYCRNTLEDIYNPVWVCQEMSRVAKAGFIETPSPIAECCRGVDGSAPHWRGYHHHRYVIWVDETRLTFIPKYPIIEYLNFGNEEENMVKILNSSPLYWNTYFFWNDSLETKLLNHVTDFNIIATYPEVLTEAMEQCMANNMDLALKYGIDF